MSAVVPTCPVTHPLEVVGDRLVTLELQDGVTLQGYSFGAEKPAAGELVFQTGMVGYPESLTDPSYEGQILVITYPLVGNYGVPDMTLEDELVAGLPRYFESNRIHVAGLVVSHYTEAYSHYLANSSLSQWLKREGIPAVYGVDTRNLTKHLRDSGSMLGRLALQKSNANLDLATTENWKSCFDVPEWINPNVENLVAKVSTKEPKLYTPPTDNKQVDIQTGPDGKVLRIIAIDVGIKYNQIRCFIKRGVELKVVPWDYDFTTEEYDGLFISNGPGDPSTLADVAKRLDSVVQAKKTPIFGICFGHQLLARSTGAETTKMIFGNRGQNIPCTSTISGRCYITSQNHGFAVDVDTLPENWEPLFVNANDGSNEGIYHKELPYFSVQFHPESTPGPRDTEFLFDVFINAVKEYKETKVLKPISFPGGLLKDNLEAHPRLQPKKVLVLGSGGLSIGQAGEFDYSGSQAIKALKEEGIYTILINPNIATIQTSKGLADKVYFLPVTTEFVRKVILHERPDAIYVTFGGQTALSVGIEMKDEFESLGVQVLGTQIDTIITTEDRELFANAIDEINEKCAKSEAANSVEEALAAVKRIGFPVIVRAAYALGGLGSGFANNEKELSDLCNVAFASSPQVLVERSMKGWKEVEYEVVRDAFDNCVTVCNMENFDPLGIHTGDSIVVAPSQTLSDADYNMLRTTAVNVIRHLGVVGECNIQYALNPFSQEYCIIEVNARLSRSSALASKATGYPLAYTAAKLGLNIPLDKVKNSITQSTCACFEPSLDYCVVKMPRWDLKKFSRVSTELSSSMKSVGEVMSIGRTFEEAIQKAIRSTEYVNLGFNETELEVDIDYELENPSDLRIFAIANAFSQLGYSVDKVWEMTNIDKWFLQKLYDLIIFGKKITDIGAIEELPSDLLREAKQCGFDDRQIAKFLNSNEVAIRRLRKELGITPFVKQIDTVAAEFPAHTNYLYMTYNASAHDLTFEDHGVMVLGSGVYRIGSSVEFDWCAVTTVRTLRANNYKTIMINYNPETVSTDYDEADRLYFETINLERILDIYEIENSQGVVVSMGGQTSNNIAMTLHRENVKVLGTSPDMIDSAENRYKFSRMLDQIGVDQPAWKELTSMDEAGGFAEKVGYPVLVRPSYVLSGAAMNTVYSKNDLESYLRQAVEVSRDYPVVITKYIENAKEIEMDAVARNGELVMHVVSEHVENAGVHSGDATLIVPPQDLAKETVDRIVVATAKIGKALKITGPYNIQFIAKDNEIKVIECNVRASRSFPFISKVVGVNLIELATKAIMGLPFDPYPVEKLPDDYVAVKVPQFSFPRLAGADPVLGVEMASTGEVATFGHSKYEAYLKSLLATGFKLPKKNILLSIGSFKEKQELLPAIQKLYNMGYKLFATAGTADFITEHNMSVQYLEVLNQNDDEKAEYSLTQHLANNNIDLYINLPSANRFRRPASYVSKGYQTRRMAVDYSVPLVTNVKCAKLLIEAISRHLKLDVSERDAQTSHRTVTIPGLINIATYVPNVSNIVDGPKELKETSRLFLESGFTYCQIMPRAFRGPVITDSISLRAALSASTGASYTDFGLTVAGTPNNIDLVGQTSSDVSALFLPYHELKNKVSEVSKLLQNWPTDKQIIAEAKTSELASILLLASLQNRSIHITGVSNKEDLALIKTVKEKDSRVTCDINVYSLFISQEQYPEGVFLPTNEDQEFFWENLDSIDAFSIGSLPTNLAAITGHKIEIGLGIKDALPLLLTAVHEGKLSVADIVLRLHDNPIKIFNLPEQDAVVEIDLDYVVTDTKRWSPHTGVSLSGGIERVIVKDETVVLSGELVDEKPSGVHVILGASNAAPTVVEAQKTIGFMKDKRFSFSAERPKLFDSVESAEDAIVEPPTLEQRLMSSKPPRELTAPTALDNLIRGKNPFQGRHILSIKQFNRSDLHALFAVAQELRAAVAREGVLNIMKAHVLTTIFYEPSTRTCSSFIAAMERLGGRVVNINPNVSSVKKGETLQDTVRTLASYTDAIVMRHSDEMSVHIAAKYSPVPIINGGNGSREHPTQAFLDLFTIREEIGTVNGITVTFMGDLKHGRTVHSLCRLLKHYQVRINLVSPSELRLPDSLKQELFEANMLGVESLELTPDIISKSDVLYCTRVQEERFKDKAEYQRLKDVYIVDNRILAHAKQNMAIMHPLPRVNEIKEEVDYDHRAAYFRQMKYGLYVRMALLAMVLGIDP
ncbi:similar to Saccharomyces cerevisiae YJL130C URA2 Bifunctional carbamoylphosphate synthetase (CPSase)-aspartate transcarbamylase (ATCase) [Maudiozyma barnettii]|uniref:Pyrimidine-specific carbamoyl phosphate synthase-aspartate carbamoyl transferase n=1 Tax=Maudiozyma barnettii TaxID=61262 RepID=A0A8H2ZI41_9SACH|nr:bifunctional carbamoylphosphate synthetase/aspartate transcarbamylase [Kazachstania barnettii]CAB4255137.1 similar to Saccharomyces cerevisiae YJL130C URA2 Bifunctional carbamoylphosphate synthetase (CPSase)-aspartate transcarbamylase (ATCase) [Kazachstania barnettii]CAD1783408.1 similar to Saccharomyces cerevisiae YJL130C URA2 Bifunctional carbamoylphosphate synthetase (CPSase)-aspartate transcarbamylase (ATCase) [Kazachstania barnettii]